MKGDVKRNIAPSTGSCPGLGVGIQPVQLESCSWPSVCARLVAQSDGLHPCGFIYWSDDVDRSWKHASGTGG